MENSTPSPAPRPVSYQTPPPVTQQHPPPPPPRRSATPWLTTLLAIVIGAIAGAAFGVGGIYYAMTQSTWMEQLEPATRLLGSVTTPVSDKPVTTVTLQEDSNVVRVVEQADPAVVSIVGRVERRSFFFNQVIESEAAGTGFVIDKENGLILTNRHVVRENAEYRIVASDGTHLMVAPEDIHTDPLNDLAILRVPGLADTNVEELILGDSSQLKPGQKLIAIGNALGKFNNTVTTGVVSALGRQVDVGPTFGERETLVDMIQTDAAINQGNSGGPLLNTLGQVIGINTAVAGAGENIGFAIPIDSVKIVIESFLLNGKIVRPWLGISYVPLTRDLATINELPTEEGAFVADLVGGGPSAKAGLLAGDIILSINDEPITTENTIIRTMQYYLVGAVVDVRLLRPDDPNRESPEYTEITLQVTLEERGTTGQSSLGR